MSTNTSSNDPLGTDEGLIRSLHDPEDHQSWEAFYQAYWKLIYHMACRRGLNDGEAREVVQDTLLSVARSLHSYRPQREGGSFKRWLLSLTRRRAVDRLRRRPRELAIRSRAQTPTGGTGTAERVPDPGAGLEVMWERDWEAHVIKAALEKLKRRVSPRHYQVFDLAVVRQQPVQRVAATVGIHLAQVYLIKHRVLREFKRMVQAFKPPD